MDKQQEILQKLNRPGPPNLTKEEFYCLRKIYLSIDQSNPNDNSFAELNLPNIMMTNEYPVFHHYQKITIKLHQLGFFIHIGQNIWGNLFSLDLDKYHETARNFK